jgi:threonine/homoserine/homoserine lactone efflux protein
MKAVLAGAVLGISLAAPPGPVTAVMAAAASAGHRREAILTALGAISGDGCYLALAALGFIAYLADHPRGVGALGLLGAALLFALAVSAVRSARRGIADAAARGSYRLGLMTVLTSPYSFAWWTANGAVLLATLGWPGILGLFASLIVYSILFTFALGWLGARFRHTVTVLAYASAAVLAVFGLQVARTALRLLGGAPLPP